MKEIKEIQPKYIATPNQCRVDLFLEYEDRFDYILSIFIVPDIDNESESLEIIKECVRSFLYNAKKSTQEKKVIYDYNYCILSVPEYPLKSGLVVRKPMIIKDWKKQGED
jgi:hypothetical protein